MASSANYFNMTPFDASQLNDPSFMPSFQLTEDDRRRMMQQALFQAGLGMIANNGKGSAAQIGGALQGGLLGYQQGAQAPQARYQQAKELLDFQGKQLGNQKSSMELQQQRNLGGLLSNISQMTASPAEMGGPMSPESPEFNMGATQKQAQAFNNPAVIAALLASGMKGSDIAAAGGRFDPREMRAGSYYQNPLTGQMDYLPQLDKGMGMRGGQIVNAPGYVQATQDQTLGNKAAEAFAEMERRKLLYPGEAKQAGRVAGEVKAAEFPFQTEDYVDEGGNTRKRFLYESTGMPGRAPNMYPGYSVSPQQQAQRDRVAQGVLNNEGNGQVFNPRLNDRPGAGLQPQMAGLTDRGSRPNTINPARVKESADMASYFVNDYYKPIMADAQKASSRLAQTDYLLSKLDKGELKVGAFAPFMTEARRYLVGAGLATEEQANTLGTSEMLRKFGPELILTGPRLEGPQSNLDTDLYRSMYANERDSQRGFNLTMSMMRANDMRKKEKASFVSAYRGANGSLEGAEEAWQNGPGNRSLFEDKRLVKFLPTTEAKAGVLKGKKVAMLPDGRLLEVQ